MFSQRVVLVLNQEEVDARSQRVVENKSPTSDAVGETAKEVSEAL